MIAFVAFYSCCLRWPNLQLVFSKSSLRKDHLQRWYKQRTHTILFPFFLALTKCTYCRYNCCCVPAAVASHPHSQVSCCTAAAAAAAAAARIECKQERRENVLNCLSVSTITSVKSSRKARWLPWRIMRASWPCIMTWRSHWSGKYRRCEY